MYRLMFDEFVDILGNISGCGREFWEIYGS
jgi:hypothetical protein